MVLEKDLTEHWSRCLWIMWESQTAELINECDSHPKTGIMFEDWATKPIHKVCMILLLLIAIRVPIAYAKLIGENVDPKGFDRRLSWDNMTPI